MINVFAFCHLLNTVVWLVSLQRQTFPSLTMNHTTTTTPTNTYYFSKLDNATHCLSLSLTMSPLILTMSPAAANLLLLCAHPLSHIVPPHLPLRSSYRVYIIDPHVHIYELFWGYFQSSTMSTSVIFVKTKRVFRGAGQATRIRKIGTSRWCALVWWETQKYFSQRIQTAGGGRGGGGGGGGGEEK